MVVQFGGVAGHPADQPYVEIVVAVQPGEPPAVGGQAGPGQQVVVQPVQDVGGARSVS